MTFCPAEKKRNNETCFRAVIIQAAGKEVNDLTQPFLKSYQ